MFKILLLAGLAVVMSNADAVAAAPCTACDRIAKLTKETKALNYKNEKERFDGQSKVMATVEELEKFEKVSKKDANRSKIFSALLALSREAGPYDIESQIAQMLGFAIKKDAGLKKSYESYLKSLGKEKAPELCKTQRMETSVSERLCLESAGIKGQEVSDKQAEKVKACVKAFSFEDCIK